MTTEWRPEAGKPAVVMVISQATDGYWVNALGEPREERCWLPATALHPLPAPDPLAEMRDAMSGINDGGPAFPVAQRRTNDGFGWVDARDGMSLRDWFAGMALSGYLSNTTGEQADCTFGDVAHSCYMQADAMLAAREPTP